MTSRRPCYNSVAHDILIGDIQRFGVVVDVASDKQGERVHLVALGVRSPIALDASVGEMITIGGCLSVHGGADLLQKTKKKGPSLM